MSMVVRVFKLINEINSFIFYYNYFCLIFKVFIIFTKQFFTFHSNRVKCEKINKFCPRRDSNPRPPAFAASVLTLDHEDLTVENKQHRG